MSPVINQFLHFIYYFLFILFPTRKPTSRYEVLQLQEALEAMLEKAGVKDEEVEVKGPTQMHNLLELIKKEQNIYNIVFHELIRQVSEL